MPFASALARRAFFARLGHGLVGIVRKGGRVSGSVDKVRKTAVGAAAETVIDAASGHEFGASMARAATSKDKIGRSLGRLAEGGAKAIGSKSGKFGKKLSRALRHSPLMMGAASGTGQALGIAGRITKRGIHTALDMAQNNPTVAITRSAATVISDEVTKTIPRNIGRALRRSSNKSGVFNKFNKYVTRPAVEALTGKTVYKGIGKKGKVLGSPGLGTATARKHGFLQHLRRNMSGKEQGEIFRNRAVTRDINKLLTERKMARKDFTHTISEGRKAIRSTITDPGQRVVAEANAKVKAKKVFGSDIAKAGNIFHYKQGKDGTVKGGKEIASLFHKRYKGANQDLAPTLAVGVASTLVGKKYAKEFGEKIRRNRYMRDRAKQESFNRAKATMDIQLAHPELDEYELNNAVEARLKLLRATQFQAADQIAIRNVLLQRAPDHPQSIKPRESGKKVPSLNKARLRKSLKKRK